MQICVAKPNGDLIYLEVEDEAVVEDVKVLVEIETSIPMSEQNLLFRGQLLSDNTKVLEAEIESGDILELKAVPFHIKQEAQNLMQQFLYNPQSFGSVSAYNPQLAEAIRSGQTDKVEEFLMIVERKNQEKQQKMQRLAQYQIDPLDPNAQLEIEKSIQQKAIEENFMYAQEFTPEVFGSVEMLYIDCTINKIPMQAFVDSGAQSTIMSKHCAERLGIMRLVDTRFQGQAVGVGVGKIIGRVHAFNIEIGGRFFNCSFQVLEASDIELLFGLDMLKRHQCCIDLHRSKLSLSAGEIEVEFIPEARVSKRRNKC